MRLVFAFFFLTVSSWTMAKTVPVYVDRAIIAAVNSITVVTGRVVIAQNLVASAEVSETVEEVKVRVGDRVNKGDLLARFSTDDIQSELDSLKAREVYLQSIRDLLIARQKLREDQLSRAKTLNTRDLLTRDAMDQAQINLIQTQSDLVKAEFEHMDVRLSIENAQRRKDRTSVLAKYSGRVVSVAASEGRYTKLGDQLFEILPDRGIELEVEVRAEAYDALQVGQIVSTQLRGQQTDLKVRALLPEQNQRTGSRVVRLSITKLPTNGLVIGESVEVRLPTGPLEKRVTISKNAVIPGKKGHRVVLVVDGKAEPRRIELGVGLGDRIAVMKGLNESDLVVTQGQEGLRKGQDVRVVRDDS